MRITTSVPMHVLSRDAFAPADAPRELLGALLGSGIHGAQGNVGSNNLGALLPCDRQEEATGRMQW